MENNLTHEEATMPGLKENLDTLRAVTQKNTGIIWGQAQEKLRVAAIEAMRHRKENTVFDQRAKEFDDTTSAINWLETLTQHLKVMPVIAPDGAGSDAPNPPSQPVKPSGPPVVDIEKPSAPNQSQSKPIEEDLKIKR
jgi:hypothetical protein